MTPAFEAHDRPDVDRVWTWFEYQKTLIGESRASVLRNRSNPNASVRPHEERFAGLTEAEVDAFFDEQKGRLEMLTMFELLATTEAVLRIEVRKRVSARKKDALSRRLRGIYKTKREGIRLDEDILAAMKEEGVPATAIGHFRGALNLRHWLAHGCHWHPKLRRGYSPNDVFDISRALIGAIPRG